MRLYGKHLPLKSMMMFGGVNINPQIKQLHGRVDILVATPGRLLDHLQQKTVDLSHVEILVLDEADRMLDMGFIRDIKRVLAVLPKQRQNLLFSATFSDEIKLLADGLLNNPALIEVARRNATAELIEQRVYPVDREKKRVLLTHLIKEHNWFQVLVFTRTKHGANNLAEHLNKEGIPALAIHGNKSQAARTRALAEFKTAKLQVLVATDIAARGIDISELPHVVNYELPNVPEDYVHRIGRTGRAGSNGEASSLVCIDEHKLLHDIERLIKREITVVQVPGFEPDPRIKAEPILNGTWPESRSGRTRTGTRSRPIRTACRRRRRVLPPDKLAQVAGRAVAQPANRRVVQVAVLLCRLQHNIVPAGVVVDERSGYQRRSHCRHQTMGRARGDRPQPVPVRQGRAGQEPDPLRGECSANAGGVAGRCAARVRGVGRIQPRGDRYDPADPSACA